MFYFQKIEQEQHLGSPGKVYFKRGAGKLGAGPASAVLVDQRWVSVLHRVRLPYLSQAFLRE